VLLGDVADPCDVDNRRVREHHVQAATAVGDRGVKPVEILLLAHVTLHAGDVVADFLDRRIEFCLAPPADEDVRALLDEPLGSGQADAGSTAGDYRCLTLEKCHDRAFR
jgi:hypothetical protein